MAHMRTPQKVYLDHAAATPLDSDVYRAMEPYWAEQFANPSALTSVAVAQALKGARARAAHVLQVKPEEVIFTSGGTESNNLALFGVVASARQMGIQPHVIVSTIEHPSVLEPARALETLGVRVTYVPVSRDGFVQLDALKAALLPETVLVSVMYANNEIGTVQPIAEIARAIRHYRKVSGSRDDGLVPRAYPYFHVDACQAPGALDLSVPALGVDLLTVNASKMYGPKGVGLLYCRKGVLVTPLFYGGAQEQCRRAGTENVPGIIGCVEALVRSESLRSSETVRLQGLRDYLQAGLAQAFPEVVQFHGSFAHRLPNNVSVCFTGLEAERLLIELAAEGIIAAAGSACSSLTDEGSHVLRALGVGDADAASTIRLTLGRSTTRESIDYVLEALQRLVPRLLREKKLQ